MASDPQSVVRRAFEDWMHGSGNFARIFAPQMKWEVLGRSVVAGRYESAEDFITKVLVPMDRRFDPSDPMRPTNIRAIYADGPAVIAIWDGAGTTLGGNRYENTYAWIFTMDRGLVVDAVAFFDDIGFNELWEIQPRVA